MFKTRRLIIEGQPESCQSRYIFKRLKRSFLVIWCFHGLLLMGSSYIDRIRRFLPCPASIIYRNLEQKPGRRIEYRNLGDQLSNSRHKAASLGPASIIGATPTEDYIWVVEGALAGWPPSYSWPPLSRNGAGTN